MVTLVLIIHLIVSFILMIIILLQSGSSADLASAFGGMSSQTSMGRHSKGNALTKLTTICAVIFMITSLSLAVMMSKKTKGESVVSGMNATPTKKAVKKNIPAKPVQTKNNKSDTSEKGFKTVGTENGKVIKVKKLSPSEVKKMLGESGSKTNNKKTPAKKGGNK